MAAIGAIPADALGGYCVLGETRPGWHTHGGQRRPSGGAGGGGARARADLPGRDGPEAAWAGGDLDVLAPRSLIQLANHFKGSQVMAPASIRRRRLGRGHAGPRRHQGQEGAKRALEIAAAGGHNLLFNGPPGAGKSMLASRLPSILPPLTPRELLDISMIQSVAGQLKGGRPLGAAAVPPAAPFGLHGGPRGRRARRAARGSLTSPMAACCPRRVAEYPSPAGCSIPCAQPLETGPVMIVSARTSGDLSARFQLVAAMNPCRCGQGLDPAIPAAGVRTSAAWRSIRRCSPARSSTGSTCASRCRRSQRRI